MTNILSERLHISLYHERLLLSLFWLLDKNEWPGIFYLGKLSEIWIFVSHWMTLCNWLRIDCRQAVIFKTDRHLMILIDYLSIYHVMKSIHSKASKSMCVFANMHVKLFVTTPIYWRLAKLHMESCTTIHHVSQSWSSSPDGQTGSCFSDCSGIGNSTGWICAQSNIRGRNQ